MASSEGSADKQLLVLVLVLLERYEDGGHGVGREGRGGPIPTWGGAEQQQQQLQLQQPRGQG